MSVHKTTSAPRQVVITGIGIVSPLGGNREESWSRLCEGESGVGWLDNIDSISVGDLAFSSRNYSPHPKHSSYIASRHKKHSSTVATLPPLHTWNKGLLAGGAAQQFLIEGESREPVIQFALQTAHEAIQDAGLNLNQCNIERFGCAIGTSKGGFESLHQAMGSFKEGSNSEEPLPGWNSFATNQAAVEVAQTFNLQGPVLCPVAACATGLVSLMQGANLITNGYCDMVLAGSSDASLQPILLGAYDRMGVLSNKFDDPATACKPFDKNRNGFLVGEGAAMFVLEDAEHAKARGAKIYAEYVTGQLATDISGMTTVQPEATSLTWLINNVLQHSQLNITEIDYINLHGTATKMNDLYETNALKKACGTEISNIPCSSLKGALGHLMGAAGSVETAFSLLAMRDKVIPPTLNLFNQDPLCDLNYTPNNAQTKEINHVLKLSFGFGGHLAAAVFRTV